MDCVNCGAPLPGKSIQCSHCGSLNDVDLRTLERSLGTEAASDRKCPRCEVLMTSVDLGIDGTFFIERCDRCLGLFFDPEELRRVLNVAARPSDEVDRERLAVMINEEYQREPAQVKYIKCPVCHELMNRKNYGAKSGVIVDSCRAHGVWLDGGELAQLVKWSNVGGQQIDSKHKQRDARAAARRKRLDRLLEEKELEYSTGRGYRREDSPLLHIVSGLFGL